VRDQPLHAGILEWSNELLGVRALTAFAARLAEGPAVRGERLTGCLILIDSRHELRWLLAGETAVPSDLHGLRFVDSLASLAPVLTALHAPWAGPYHAADHGLIFDGAQGLTHLVLLPLPYGTALHGVYAVGAKGALPAFAGLEAGWSQHVGAQALASAERLFQRARLLRAGVVDPLTGWNSRHYFQARLREQVAASTRRHEPATCLLVDLDGLAALNETHGVAAGDAALREVGNRIEAQVRGSDSFAHLGDDEFGILLPGTTASEAVPLAARILAAMRAAPVEVGVSYPLRVSIGLAGLDPAELPASLERKAVADQWLAETQAALHYAKRAGGDAYALGSAGKAALSAVAAASAAGK
jgi:diguanylate cyclase (GGDEF)-like protein